jgi:SpoVK/Ycf46/Vps4 family AAA+-type ATPase
MNDVGGLKNLVEWLKLRKMAFYSDAEEYGLSSPRGVMFVGTTGCVLRDTKIKIKKISNKGKHIVYEE